MSTSRRAPLSNAYWRQWTASVISNLGDGINFVAVPLLALSLTQDTRLLASVTAATMVPWLLLALPVGVLVDRRDRRSLMVLANAARVGLFGIVAVSASAGWASIWLLFLVLLVIGACEVVFDSGAQAFLPQIVESAALSRANGLLVAAEVVAGSIAGLSIGALLFDIDPSIPFVVNAASFAIAALLIVSIRVPASSKPSKPPDHDMRLASSVRWLREHRLLRTLAAMFTVTNLGLMFGQGVFVKYAVDELGLANAEFGILLAITAMGAATGGLIGHRVVNLLGLRAAVILPYLVFAVGNLVIGLTHTVWLVAVAGFVLGAAVTVWNVVTVTVRQQQIPPDRFGRVNGVYRLLGATAGLIGVAAGGWVAYRWGVRAPFLVGGSITVLAAVLFARPVLAGLKRAPD